MIELQSVSAGSGKTFHLAKIFIRDFLTYHKDVAAKASNADEKVFEGQARHFVLREPEDVYDAHSHILAITFTNKATNEMKERVVEKLADLARGYRVDKETGAHKDSEYMEYFLTSTYTSDGRRPAKEQVMATARAGLEELLYNYTDFNISTIDSFFQQILRTFAFELDLPDSMELELDSDYLSKTGVDMTLRSINIKNDPNHQKTKDWINRLIANRQDSASKWNILPSSTRSSDLYDKLTSIIAKVTDDKFTDSLAELRNYFRSENWKGTGLSGTECFYKYYNETSGYYRAKTDGRREDLRHAVEEFHESVASVPCGAKEVKSPVFTVVMLAEKVAEGKKIESAKLNTAVFKKLSTGVAELSDVFSKNSKIESGLQRRVVKCAERVAQGLVSARMAECMEQNLVGNLFYVGMIGIVADNMESFRESNNLLPLSDTNSILGKIVGDGDDAPFIFERLGTLLRHFLIDEFQDTSMSQWNVIRPLLAHTESCDYDNLIIGDAKQSIYRFRHAEPELITYGVEKEFPLTNSRTFPLPNTNWRSCFTVVDFNNSVFPLFAAILDKEIKDSGGILRRSPSDIYRNVGQKAAHGDINGYVEVRFGPNKDYVENIGEMIAGLLDEGWTQREIAVLCDKNSQCADVIASIMGYNGRSATHKIEVMSEQALSVAESTAVKIIVAVLALIAEGNLREGYDEEDSGMSRHAEFSKETLETVVAMQLASGKLSSPADIDAGNLVGAISPDIVDAMLESMPAISLPALVDAIASTPEFVPKELLKTEGAYIAAFQDAVIDFCDRYPADPASFLAWWRAKGSGVTIAAPDGADAVTVMTVHKSKGLEFGVVIIPEADWRIDITHRDSTVMWVKPNPATCSDPRTMPPIIPVGVGSDKHEMVGSFYAREYLEEFDRTRIDALNKAYVAFTRARGELYVNCAKGPKDISVDSSSLTRYMYDILKELASEHPDKYSFEEDVFVSGRKCEAVGHADLRSLPSRSNVMNIKEYYLNSPMPRLNTVASDDTQGKLADSEPVPREYGLLLHDVMCGMVRLRDLENSIMRLRVRGLLNEAAAGRCRKRIKEALEISEVRDWFDDGLRVMNERSILRRNEKNARADRVVDTGEELMIIDYKTGQDDKPHRYFRQIRKYMGLYGQICERQGLRRRVVGKLLFIPADDTKACHVVNVPCEED